MNEDAPTDKTVDNKAALTVNNGVTPSNKVENEPPVIKPSKQDTQKDPTINIDGKTALLGDKVYYRVNIDASRLTDTAYKVWRLGMTDDYDQNTWPSTRSTWRSLTRPAGTAPASSTSRQGRGALRLRQNR